MECGRIDLGWLITVVKKIIVGRSLRVLGVQILLDFLGRSDQFYAMAKLSSMLNRDGRGVDELLVSLRGSKLLSHASLERPGLASRNVGSTRCCRSHADMVLGRLLCRKLSVRDTRRSSCT